MGLTVGWNAWLDEYLGRKRTMQLLAGSGVRMMKPKLVACYRLWHDDWDAAQKAAAAKGIHQLKEGAADVLRERDQLKEKLARLERRLDAAGGILDDKDAADERAKALALELEAEREKRVAHLQQ
eukprot:697222-Prymnesium_polylepis.1